MIPILAVLGTGPGSEGSLLASVRGHIRSSAGVGARWTLPRDNPSRGFVLSLAAHPDHPGVFYAGTSGEGLLRSTDGGGKWAPLSRQLGRTGVRAIAVDGALPGILWLATDEGVLGSGDGGLTWAAFNQGLARGPIYAIAIDPWRPGILYAGGAGGLFRSDFGQVWTSVALPKSSGGVLSLLFREDGDLLVGTRNTGVLELCLFE